MTVQQSDQQQLVDKPRRKRKRLLWLILPAALVLIAGAVAAFWLHEHGRVNPAYTAAVERLYDAEAPEGEMWYMPRWVPDGYMPKSLKYSFRLSLEISVNDESSSLSFNQNKYPCIFDMDVQRTYTRRHKGMEYLYTEKHQDEYINQLVIWQYEDTQLYMYYWNAEGTPLSEDALFRMAYSVEPYTPKAKV